MAELVVPKTDGIEGADLVGAVSDLGVALSVMRGTKVVWVYPHDFSGNQIVHTTHRRPRAYLCSRLRFDHGQKRAYGSAGTWNRGRSMVNTHPRFGKLRVWS
jgi:hypothetical protein